MTIQDENVEAVRTARESLIRKFRGLGGWFRHLQERDRQREIGATAKRHDRKKAQLDRSSSE